MKRLNALTFTCFVFIAGCMQTDHSLEPDDAVHYYQFSLPQDREAFAELLELFKKEHPGIRIEIHSLPTASDDQHQFYLTHAQEQGRSRIDVMAVDVIWLAQFARAGLLMPVDTIFSSAEWDAFFASSVKAATYQGQRFAVPFFVDGGLLYSRKDLLQKYGYKLPPQTWAELIRMSRDILQKENDPGLTGFVWQGKQYEGLICNFLEYLPDEADPLVGDSGQSELNFDQVAVRKALALMASLVHTHRVSPQSVFSMSEEESRHVFQNGKAVFMRNWPYAWKLAQQEGSPVAGKIQASPLPAVEEGRRSHGTLGGFLLGINPKTPHPEAAEAWVRFLSSKPAQKIIWEMLGLTPARKTVFPQLLPGGFPMDILQSIMESTTPRPVTPLYTPLSQSIQAYISGALVGVYSVDQSIELIESDARRIMRILNG